MALTETQTTILKMIFVSEVDYTIIKNRATALQAISNRTPEQEAELQAYLAQMAHDETVIQGYITYLAGQGVTLTGGEKRTIRDLAMTTFNGTIQERINQQNALLAYINSKTIIDSWEELYNLPEPPADMSIYMLRPEYENTLAGINSALTELNAAITTVTNLKKLTKSIWQA